MDIEITPELIQEVADAVATWRMQEVCGSCDFCGLWKSDRRTFYSTSNVCGFSYLKESLSLLSLSSIFLHAIREAYPSRD